VKLRDAILSKISGNYCLQSKQNALAVLVKEKPVPGLITVTSYLISIISPTQIREESQVFWIRTSLGDSSIIPTNISQPATNSS